MHLKFLRDFSFKGINWRVLSVKLDLNLKENNVVYVGF